MGFHEYGQRRKIYDLVDLCVSHNNGFVLSIRCWDPYVYAGLENSLLECLNPEYPHVALSGGAIGPHDAEVKKRRERGPQGKNRRIGKRDS